MVTLFSIYQWIVITFLSIQEKFYFSLNIISLSVDIRNNAIKTKNVLSCKLVAWKYIIQDNNNNKNYSAYVKSI